MLTSSMALGMVWAAPATADNGNTSLLELSADGVNYAPGTLQNVFDSHSAYVPGETRKSRVWVRNASKEEAAFSLAVINTERSNDTILPEYLSLHAASANYLATAGRLPGPGRCALILENRTMAAGESAVLNLDLSLDLRAPNSTRNQASTFELVFLLQGLNGGQPVSPCSAGATTNPPVTSSGIVPVSGGTVTRSPQAMDLQSRSNDGVTQLGYHTALTGDTELSEALTPAPYSRYIWPANELPHSNVAANARSSWPWIVTLGFAGYMLISLRRRRETE